MDDFEKKGSKRRQAWSPSRRGLLKGGGALALSSVVPGGVALAQEAAKSPAIIAHKNERLVVNALAGPQSNATLKHISEPFEQKFKVKVEMDDTGTSAQDYAKIRATGGSPGWDVNASLTPEVLVLGEREELFEILDEERIPNFSALWPQVWDHVPRSGAPFGVQYLGLHYNREKMEAPTSWLDYWQPQNTYGEKALGRLLMARPTNLISIYAMMLGTIARGGDATDLSPTWEMMAEAREYFGHTAGSVNKAQPLFDNGELWMTPQWSTRAKVERDRGSEMEFVMPKEGTLPLVSASAIPIGAVEKELAFEWVNFRLEPEIHRNFCLGYEMGPSRRDMGNDWPDYFKADQITTEEEINRLANSQPNLIAASKGDWAMRWQEIMGA